MYKKLRYVSRLDYPWEHMKRNGVELSEFVYDHREDLEYCPFMDYGLECDHRASTSLYSHLSTYSMSWCIS
ncbi:hypothetical protein K1719_032653 [Acacia pycnantha]|nr:hypothetical protein K1719_032653 [Acacia pycnantha]